MKSACPEIRARQVDAPPADSTHPDRGARSAFHSLTLTTRSPFKESDREFDGSTMTSAQLLSAIGNGLFTLAMLVAAVRCLLLWRRTRQLPELAVGAGFFLIAGVGYPLMAASGLGNAAAAGVNLWLLGGGLAGIGLGIFSLQVFIWQAFRPGAAWAAGLAFATLAAGVVVTLGAIHALASAPSDVAPVESGRSWWLALRLLFEAWYVWTAAESLHEYTRARRRQAIGLSDPVVVNRFLLFGGMGAYLAVNGAVAMVLEFNGASPLVDMAPALVLAANGTVAAALILLAFLPPKAYVDFIRARDAAAAA
jgi:hypothetical protein